MHSQTVLYLDNEYNIQPDSWVVVQKAGSAEPIITQLSEKSIATPSIAAYGLSGKTTRLDLDTQWISDPQTEQFSTIRGTVVYAQSEELILAEAPIEDVVGIGSKLVGIELTNAANRIELNGLYDGLESGRWVIVSGERADIPGVKSSELVMLLAVEQTFRNLPNEKPHTTLVLANSLAYSYKRDTVTIYGNVVKATHGETRTEVLGSGDGSKPFQHFPLKQPPLTYMAAPSAVGAASTLEIRVNEVLWHETDSLVGLNQNDRNYVLRTEDNGNTTAIFGNGQTGARLPSGVENIRAVYRSGIGKAGNVKVEQISILATRPLGLKGVINPLAATGGADRESRDRARRNIPLAVMALDRLVSTQDYADFARTFAGIGKASAKELSNGWQQVVHVTIAGADDIPIDQNSDLYRNLLQALQQQGDPHQPIQLVMRELMVLILVANVKILPDYLWELVEPKIRAALLDTFSFERRELGQSVSLSELISTVQKVPGVDFVDVDIFDSISETEAKTITAKAESPNQPTLSSKLEDIAKGIYNVAKSAQSTVESADSANRPEKQKQPRPNIPVNLARIEQGKKGIQPAQLAIFSPEIVDTLILTEVKP
jgi:predicted phage baseplate assembly protein